MPCELNAVGNTEIICAAIEQAVFIFVFHPDFANIGKFKDVFSNSEVVNRGVAITQIQDESVFTIASIEFVDAYTGIKNVVAVSTFECVVPAVASENVVISTA